MTTYPLHLRDGHLFLQLDGALWLLDTGSPSSFGTQPGPSIAGRQFDISPEFHGLDVASLGKFVGVNAAGLLGADVLNEFNWLFDVRASVATIGPDRATLLGTEVPFESRMGLPVLNVSITDREHRMIFDTGAQLSYLHTDGLAQFPGVGRMEDFYPGFGTFETETHDVPMRLGGIPFTVRCGALPALLQTTLSLFGTEGIIGNQMLGSRTMGYFPSRGVMVIG
jgi:hypothetical protein